MPSAADIRPHMEVLGSDGLHIGTVDAVEGGRMKLTRRDSNDGEHHYVSVTDVTRVDDRVHVGTTAAAMGLLAVAGVTGAKADDGHAPFPPIRNRAVEGARPRGNYYLPWIVGLVGLLALFLLIRSCAGDREAQVAPAPVANAPVAPPLPAQAVQLPGGRAVQLSPQTLPYQLQDFLASGQQAPHTFAFDRLGFDTGSAALRPQDQSTVNALGDILTAYPNAKVTITGYTDAQGGAGANAQLGSQRAEAVAGALSGQGIGSDRVTTASGGEGNPADTNDTAGGRSENRRTELTVTAK